MQNTNVDKSMWLSERENETTTLTRDELIKEINRVTLLPSSELSKLLEIRYLMKHYFKIAPNEELPNLN